jgi:hypothetical protein
MACAIEQILEQAIPANMSELQVAAVGRIVAATIEEIEVECFAQEAAPPLGALVVTMDGEPAIFGAVAAITTAGVDASRPLVPHGDAGEDLESVLARNPHLPLLLRTSFSTRILASVRSARVKYGPPDSPPSLFGRVRVCDQVEVRQFVSDATFLQPLLAAADPGDDLPTAFLRLASRSDHEATDFLVRAGRAMVPLLGGDPGRLTSILRRIRP